MLFHDFLGQIQHRAQLSSLDESLRATRATLETLAERLAGEAPAHLAAQLPQEIAVFLRSERAGAGERFSADDFFQRISQREGVDLPAAVYHARVVLEVLRDAVTPGEMAKLRAQLPADYQRVFEAGSQGPVAS